QMLRRFTRSVARQVAEHLPRSAPPPASASDGVVDHAVERNLLLAGRLAAFEVRRLETIDALADVEFRVTSQFGEDGIIDWLCHQLPQIPRTFVEFGVGNYREANTRFLVQNRGWRGLVMDGSAPNMQAVREEPLYWMHDVTAVAAFITVENIDGL